MIKFQQSEALTYHFESLKSLAHIFAYMESFSDVSYTVKQSWLLSSPRVVAKKDLTSIFFHEARKGINLKHFFSYT